MKSRTLLSMLIALASLPSVAVAIAPIPTPVPRTAARPLVANRPIFVTSAPAKSATTATVGKSTTLPKHRQPLAAPVKKDGSAKPAGTAAMPINRSAPMHRVPLGW